MATLEEMVDKLVSTKIEPSKQDIDALKKALGSRASLREDYVRSVQAGFVKQEALDEFDSIMDRIQDIVNVYG